ncbi:hypothetical protein BH10BAC1_BH10BAC1_13370 [soil metagenome]
MNKKIITYFCSLLFALTVQAQAPEWVTVSKDNMAIVFEQMSNWYKNNTNYSVVVTHTSYQTHTTTVPYEKSVGFFKKEKNNYHSFLLGIHTIQNTNCKIILDTANNAMMVANVDNSIWTAYTLEDYKYTLKMCKEIKVVTINTDKKYRLEYSEGYPLERYEFIVAADGSLKEVIWYYSKKIPKDIDDENSEKVKPRLSITLSAYKKLQSGSNKNEFDETKYFVKKGNKLFPSEKYKNFTLSDQRIVLTH